MNRIYDDQIAWRNGIIARNLNGVPPKISITNGRGGVVDFNNIVSRSVLKCEILCCSLVSRLIEDISEVLRVCTIGKCPVVETWNDSDEYHIGCSKKVDRSQRCTCVIKCDLERRRPDATESSQEKKTGENEPFAEHYEGLAEWKLSG